MYCLQYSTTRYSRSVLPSVQYFLVPSLVPDIHSTLYLVSAPLYYLQYSTTGQMMMMMIKIAP